MEKVIASIKKNKRFLITTHTSPEGDALGSALAFYSLVRRLGKKAVIINDDSLPDSYDFLPDLNKIRRFDGKKIKFDCFVALDCSCLSRCGRVYKLNYPAKPVINIDHHISNEKFGDVNWIEPHLSSCSEMVYRLYKRMKVPFDKDTALFLYVGILTDTGSFRYSNTMSPTHRAISELLEYKIDVAGVYKHIYEDIPFRDVKLLAAILPLMRRSTDGKIVWLQVGRKMLKNTRFSFDLSEHILSFARAVKDMRVAALFKENLGTRREIRVNLRSDGRVDVNKIARFFGGGGHRTASGITISGTLNQVRRKVLSKIEEAVKK